MTRKPILLGVGVAALVLIAAGASAYVATEMRDDAPKAAAVKPAAGGDKITWNDPKPAPAPAQQVSNCDDGNVVGTVGGGLVGGLVGSQIGKGNGNTAATIGGAVGGAYLGNRYIPTDNVTCAR